METSDLYFKTAPANVFSGLTNIVVSQMDSITKVGE